jgi:hypothetical protein
VLRWSNVFMTADRERNAGTPERVAAVAAGAG